MPIPKLYTHEESGNSYKVRLLAALLKIELEHIEIDQPRSPDFLAINPRGTIPALVDGTKTLIDSAAILVYLAGSYADPNTGDKPSRYWSVDVVEQATIVDWLAFTASWIQHGICKARAMVSFGGPYFGLGSANTEETLNEAQIRGHQSLEILQEHLKDNDWLALGRPTIGDVAVFPYVALARMGEISLEAYPAVQLWVQRMKNLDGFIPIKGLDDPMYRRT